MIDTAWIGLLQELQTCLYKPRNLISGTERTMEPMVAPAVLCTRVLRVSSGYIMRVVVPDAMPPASAARTSSFPVLSFCAGGPAAGETYNKCPPRWCRPITPVLSDEVCQVGGREPVINVNRGQRVCLQLLLKRPSRPLEVELPLKRNQARPSIWHIVLIS